MISELYQSPIGEEAPSCLFLLPDTLLSKPLRKPATSQLNLREDVCFLP